jgi:serine/threonine protein kinase
MELCAASLDQLFLKSGDPRKYKGPALPPHLLVFLQLASGLEHIHSKNLFHRDIKPANVLIFVHSTTGQIIMKWADFGLSKFVNERGTCTLSGNRGTEYYFAPELLKRLINDEELGRGDIKSDVFAFALVIGYLLLDGQHLYGANYDIINNIMNKSPVNMDSKFYNLEKYKFINMTNIKKAEKKNFSEQKLTARISLVIFSQKC